MAEQGDAGAVGRNEAAKALTILSINDVDFFNGLKTNPEATLWSYGFALSPEEMDLVRDLFVETGGLSDAEILEGLEDSLEQDRDRRWPW